MISQYLLRDFLAEHVRHDDVGDEQVDLALVAAGDVEGFRAVGRGDHLVAVAGEDPLGDLAQGFLVLDDQDGLSPGRALVGRGLGRQRTAASVVTGSVMLKVVPAAGFGVDPDVAVGLGEDPVDGGQAEPGSAAVGLGGEERLERVRRRPRRACRCRCR